VYASVLVNESGLGRYGLTLRSKHPGQHKVPHGLAGLLKTLVPLVCIIMRTFYVFVCVCRTGSSWFHG